VNPFFFGTSDKQLLGIHHPPERDEVKNGAVLLCPPFGHEYISAHGSLQHLASNLARAGFHALRFDYYGCGDSAGDIDTASLEQWVEDVGTAVQELKDTSGSRSVCIVGLRLGGLIAALAAARARAAKNNDIRAVVLWEPLVRGRDYVEQVSEFQRRWLSAMYLRPPINILDSEGPEFMGFRFPQAIQDELEAVDLTAQSGPLADDVFLVQNGEGTYFDALQGRLSSQGIRFACEVVPASPAWAGEHWQTIALPPVEVVRRIAQWISGVYE